MERTEPSRTLRITELMASDLPEVVAIEQHSNWEPWTYEAFMEELFRPHSSLSVARLATGCGEIVAGYICFWLVADEVQILNLAVHEAHRRQGIGRELLLHCLQYGLQKRACRVVLEVRSSNLAAQNLYRSLGFQVEGERPDYYGGLRERAVLMGLALGLSEHSDRVIQWRKWRTWS